MKALLVAIDSKFIHSNLAVRSLRAHAASCAPINIAEYTINQPLGKIMADICGKAPDLLFFSCYIWNIRHVEELVCDIAKVMPGVDIWLGGPEVSFDAKDALRRLPAVKGILRGEGEESFRRVLERYGCAGRTDGVCTAAGNDVAAAGSADFAAIRGVTFRNADGSIVSTPEGDPLHPDSLPFPYPPDGMPFSHDTGGQDADSAPLQELANRIIYYESSRGCPFRCSYCLSSVEKSLRFRSLDRVKQELKLFLDRRVPQVKFVDRTFNCHAQRALEIWRFLRENDNGVTNFHFEIAGDLLTDDAVWLLGDMRPGLVQLEIGVQTTNPDTLREIGRPMDFDRLAASVKKLRERNNVHLHLDLIAGLPYEDMDSFEKSFDDVFRLGPHQLQLGFLKVLKGSPMEKRYGDYGLKHTGEPPYEVLETKWMSYSELTRLKRIEEMVDLYHNSGRFCHTLELLEPYFGGTFRMFDRLAAWYRKRGLEMLNISRNGRYENLLAFGREAIPEQTGEEKLMDALILDYYTGENIKNRPDFFRADPIDKHFIKTFYSMEAREHRYLTSRQCMETDDPRTLRRLTHLELLGGRLLLFDHTRRDAVSGSAVVMDVSMAL